MKKFEVPKDTNVSIIDCDGLQIAGTVESTISKCDTMYYPANFLMYVEWGELTLNVDGEEFRAGEGEFLLVRKYTRGTYAKSFGPDRRCFREHVFVLHDEFIREVIRQFEVPTDVLPCTLQAIPFKHSPVLLGLMKSIEVYITGQVQLNRSLMRMKTYEALHALIQERPELVHIFNDFSEPARADLVEFMEHNYVQNLSLDDFAKLSGRSLSTFNREFRKLFRMSPHKWIRSRRLNLARKLMESAGLAPSEVYLEVGFQDLAHFSRSFKSEFGVNPSTILS